MHRDQKVEPLSTNLTDKLREDILRENISLGSKLTEKNICEQYSVSRTPVRESLQKLSSEGLIELIPNKGAYVIGFSIGDMRDLYKMRCVYEVQAVTWAIERIYKEELENLEKIIEYLELATDKKDINKLRSFNIEFHKIIYEASHNRMLIDTLTTYQYYINNSALVETYRPEQIAQIFEEHAEIFDAFIDRSVRRGKVAMNRHIKNAMARSGF